MLKSSEYDIKVGDNVLVSEINGEVFDVPHLVEVVGLEELGRGEDKVVHAVFTPHIKSDESYWMAFGLNDGDVWELYDDDVWELYNEDSPFPSFSEAASTGKTLSDYTGVKITEDTIGFQPDNDAINHPSHYTQGSIEVIDMLEELAGSYDDPVESYLISTAGKYLFRANHKGNKQQDLKKAVWYIRRALNRSDNNVQ